MQFGSTGRRVFAVLASVVLLAGSFLPPLHIHFASHAGSVSVAVVHQHVEPHHHPELHHGATQPHLSLSDDDDDSAGRTIDQQWHVPDAGRHHADVAIASFDTSLAQPVEHGARIQTSAAAASPPEPLLGPASLRAPPSIA